MTTSVVCAITYQSFLVFNAVLFDWNHNGLSAIRLSVLHARSRISLEPDSLLCLGLIGNLAGRWCISCDRIQTLKSCPKLVLVVHALLVGVEDMSSLSSFRCVCLTLSRLMWARFKVIGITLLAILILFQFFLKAVHY